MEKQILERLSKRGSTDFMIFRTDFPMTGEFKPAFENLKRLDLIENELENNKTLVTLTLDGIDATKNGLDKWVKEKVYTEIKNREFILTKSTTDLEINALRDLEDDGFVYEYDKRKYKVSPNKTLDFKSKKEKTSLPGNKIQKQKKTKLRINWDKIFQFLGWFIGILIALLAIIEYKFHYVSSFWEWIIEQF